MFAACTITLNSLKVQRQLTEHECLNLQTQQEAVGIALGRTLLHLRGGDSDACYSDLEAAVIEICGVLDTESASKWAHDLSQKFTLLHLKVLEDDAAEKLRQTQKP